MKTINKIDLQIIIDKLYNLSTDMYNSDNDELINMSFKLDKINQDLQNLMDA